MNTAAWLGGLSVFVVISVATSNKIKAKETSNLYWNGFGMGLFGGVILSLIIKGDFIKRIKSKEHGQKLSRGVYHGIFLSLAIFVLVLIIASTSK